MIGQSNKIIDYYYWKNISQDVCLFYVLVYKCLIEKNSFAYVILLVKLKLLFIYAYE